MSAALALAALSGACFAAGATAVALGMQPAPARLIDVFRRLDEAQPVVVDLPPTAPPFTQRVVKALRLPLLPGQERMLALRGLSTEQFFEDKIVLAMVGLVAPTVMTSMLVFTDGLSLWMPAFAAPLGMLIGYFVPDLKLLKQGSRTREDVGEALFTFFDLVALERLANRSAPQALASAAQLSDVAIFRHIRAAVERARLEQRPPYAELQALSEELQVPELADIADVMQLDETGASLAGVLRDRVNELRDAHLTRSKITAHAASERMTVWMVLPVVVFGLLLLAPPLLRLAA